jgi:hypothetical protein
MSSLSSIHSPFYELEARRGDGLAFAKRATSRSVQTGSFLEGETTLIAMGRFHGKTLGVCRFGNMLEVIEDFLLFYAKQLGNFPQIKPFSLQGLGDHLPQG